MGSPCSELQHGGLTKYINWMFDNQKKVYEELCASVGKIQDAECRDKVESLVMQSQLIFAGLSIVRSYIQKGDDPTALAFQLSQIFRTAPTK